MVFDFLLSFHFSSFSFYLEDVDGKVLVDIETANEALRTADDVLSLYIEVLDHALPWKEFKTTLSELEKNKKNYSRQSASLIGDIKLLMNNGIDAYYHASKFISGWCSSSTPLLTTYVELFRNDHTIEKAHTQKELLVEVLEKGVKEMKAAQDEIKRGSNSFNSAVGHLTTLNSRFHFEFDEKSTYFKSMIKDVRTAAYVSTGFFGLFGLVFTALFVELKIIPEVKERMAKIQAIYVSLELKVEKAFHDVDETKIKLNKEIMQIGLLKVDAENTRTFVDLDDIPDLRDTLIESGQSLINKCQYYRRKYAEQNIS